VGGIADFPTGSEVGRLDIVYEVGCVPQHNSHLGQDVAHQPASSSIMDTVAERISEAEFHLRAEQAIAELERAFGELAEERDIDVQVEGGVLSVAFDEGEPGRFIVSPNSSVRQIWVSARLSSLKFDWSQQTEQFVLAATGETLRQAMTRLTQEQLDDNAVAL
jgi:iron donor protein CyaY